MIIADAYAAYFDIDLSKGMLCPYASHQLYFNNLHLPMGYIIII
jgi:hypothetical protein